MCTGRVDPVIVAQALKKGLDGLLVVGCHFGECNYISGNYQAKAKLDMARKLIKHVGVNEERLSFQQCSSGEGALFAEIVSKYSETIRNLGPIGGEADRVKAPEIFKKLETAEAVLSAEKIRWVIGKRTPFLESGNMYGEIFTEHEFNRAIDMIIVEETEVQEILGKLKEGSQSVRDLAKALSIPSERVFRYVTALKRKGMIKLKEISGQTPIFQLVPQEV